MNEGIKAALESNVKPSGVALKLGTEIRVTKLYDRRGNLVGTKTETFTVINANDLMNAMYKEDERWFASQENQYRNLI